MDKIPESVKYIRYEAVVYERVGDQFKYLQEYPSINAAKKFTRSQPLGSVMRKESVELKYGKGVFYKSLIT